MAIIRCLRFVVIGETAALVAADVVYKYFPQMCTYVVVAVFASFGWLSCMSLFFFFIHIP
jgi:hypothetical protein